MKLMHCVALIWIAVTVVGCNVNPINPEMTRDYGRNGKWSGKMETFEVRRPYTAVTQYIKQKSEECLNRTFQITREKRSGFMGTTAYDAGTTKYIPISNITPTKAEFYTKYWDSKQRAANTPAGDTFVFYVADVTPKGRNVTSIDLYYFTFERYNWGYHLIKAWANGEDPGCPALNGMY